MRVSNLTDASVRAGKLVDARLTGEGKGNAEAFRQSAPECSSLTFFVSRHAMEKTPSLSSIHQCTCMQLQVLPNRSFWWHLWPMNSCWCFDTGSHWPEVRSTDPILAWTVNYALPLNETIRQTPMDRPPNSEWTPIYQRYRRQLLICVDATLCLGICHYIFLHCKRHLSQCKEGVQAEASSWSGFTTAHIWHFWRVKTQAICQKCRFN